MASGKVREHDSALSGEATHPNPVLIAYAIRIVEVTAKLTDNYLHSHVRIPATDQEAIDHSGH